MDTKEVMRVCISPDCMWVGTNSESVMVRTKIGWKYICPKCGKAAAYLGMGKHDTASVCRTGS